MKVFFSGLALLLMAMISAQAQMAVGEGAQQDQICRDATSTGQMVACLDQAYQRADRELNRLWGQVQAQIRQSSHMPPAVRAEWRRNLLMSQRHWVAFKEAECKGVVPFKYWQGSIARIEAMDCLLRRTLQRNDDLRGYLALQSGGR